RRMKLPQNEQRAQAEAGPGTAGGGAFGGHIEAFDLVSGYFASKAVRLRERLFNKTNAVSRGLADTTCHSNGQPHQPRAQLPSIVFCASSARLRSRSRFWASPKRQP